jgi:hypothetical protein
MPRRAGSIRSEAARRNTTTYRIRAERARGRGFRSYAYELEQRNLLRNLELRPNFIRPEDIPLAAQEGGIQGPSSIVSPDPDWDYYWPTRTINPPRPRTLQSRYSRQYECLEVVFRDGTQYHYSDVPEAIWMQFKRTESPGRYINRVLDEFPRDYGGWGSIVGEACAKPGV